MTAAGLQSSADNFISDFRGIKESECLEVKADSRLSRISVAFDTGGDMSLSIAYECHDIRDPKPGIEHQVTLQELVSTNSATRFGNMVYVTFEVNGNDLRVSENQKESKTHEQLFRAEHYLSANPTESINELFLSKINDQTPSQEPILPKSTPKGACIDEPQSSPLEKQVPQYKEILNSASNFHQQNELNDKNFLISTIRLIPTKKTDEKDEDKENLPQAIPPITSVNKSSKIKRLPLKEKYESEKPINPTPLEHTHPHKCTDGCCHHHFDVNALNYY